ncbi:MAG: ubiquinol-cytochrome C chaperone family protein, partial [Hyphomicrobiaceae bacterium]
MLNWLRSRSLTGKTAAGLYGSIVAQARQPAFFSGAGVPDTMEGRFGMIGVHMFLVLERIRREGAEGQKLARALLECFMTDMDDNMREIGIGDIVVPRRVKKAAAALHEQLDAYRAALATGSAPATFVEPLVRYVYLERKTGAPDRLAAYMTAAARHLDQLGWNEIST